MLDLRVRNIVTLYIIFWQKIYEASCRQKALFDRDVGPNKCLSSVSLLFCLQWMKLSDVDKGCAWPGPCPFEHSSTWYDRIWPPPHFTKGEGLITVFLDEEGLSWSVSRFSEANRPKGFLKRRLRKCWRFFEVFTKYFYQKCNEIAL